MYKMLRAAVLAASLTSLGACAQLSDQDKAALSTASTNAAEAKALAQQALDTARAAQADVRAAAQAATQAAQGANQAAQAAREESEKVDRMFGRSLRKAGKAQ